MNLILGYLFYFIASTASPLQRRWLAKRSESEGVGQIHFAFQVSLITFVLGLICLPLFFGPIEFSGNLFPVILLALAAGLSGASYLVTSYIAQKHVEAGVGTLVANIYTPITIIFSSIFLSESLTPPQILGTALLLAGILITSKKHRIGRFTFDRYFLLMLASGVILAVLLTAERALQKMTGFTAGTLLSWGAGSLVLGIVVLVMRSRSSYSLKNIGITGGLRFLQNLSWLVLLAIVGNLSLVSAVTTFKVVVMFIAGALILGEKEDMGRKLLGSLIAVGGLLLMK